MIQYHQHDEHGVIPFTDARERVLQRAVPATRRHRAAVRPGRRNAEEGATRDRRPRPGGSTIDEDEERKMKVKTKRITYQTYLDLGGAANPSLSRKRGRDGVYHYYMELQA